MKLLYSEINYQRNNFKRQFNMEKKIYVSPVMEINNLLSMDVTMQHAFGPASNPEHAGAPERRTEVF